MNDAAKNKYVGNLTRVVVISVEHGLHNWLNTRPGGKDDITSMSRVDSNDTMTYQIDQSVGRKSLSPIFITVYIPQVDGTL